MISLNRINTRNFDFDSSFLRYYDKKLLKGLRYIFSSNWQLMSDEESQVKRRK